MWKTLSQTLRSGCEIQFLRAIFFITSIALKRVSQFAGIAPWKPTAHFSNYDVWIWTAHSCIYLGFEFADVPPVCGFICCWGIQISSSVADVVLPLLGLCMVWINFVQNCTNWTVISVQEWPNENLTPPHMRAALVGCGNLFLNILV
jgi:hypothetical protein